MHKPVHNVAERKSKIHLSLAGGRGGDRAGVALTDLRNVLGFSSFCVLFYYAITNASAWTLSPSQRRWPRALSALGLVGCITLAFTLPGASVLTGLAVLAAGTFLWRIRRALNTSA